MLIFAPLRYATIKAVTHKSKKAAVSSDMQRNQPHRMPAIAFIS
jgi:hypothetical protein